MVNRRARWRCQSLSDWATAASEASPTWRPPLGVGLVYLWVDGVPAGVLDGIHAFFQRLPARTVVYPTIYGRLRQGRARLTAGDISRLDEVPYLDGYRPNMVDAIRLNLVDLANDPAPLKILVLVTDGRDYADPKGEGPGDFAALGADLRRAGIALLVTRFRPEADADQAAANLRDLSRSDRRFPRRARPAGGAREYAGVAGPERRRPPAGRAADPLALAALSAAATGSRSS